MKINQQVYYTNSSSINSSKEIAQNKTVENTQTAQTVNAAQNNIGILILSKLESINTLDNIQKLMFLKDMLNLPNEWKDFLIFASFQSYPDLSSEQLLSKLINLNLVKDNLNKTSNEILNKLIKLLTPQMAAKSSEIRQMMEVLQKFLPSAELQSADMLKDIMLMYLPYLPLKEDFRLILKDKTSEDKQQEDDGSSVIIILTTKNMGTFKIEIYLENSNVQIQIDNNSDKLSKKFLTNLKELKKKMDIKSEISIVKNKNIQSSKEQTQHIIPSSPKVHPKVLIAAYEIIKMILDTDNQLSLIKSRKQS